jgi:hypothetical protein
MHILYASSFALTNYVFWSGNYMTLIFQVALYISCCRDIFNFFHPKWFSHNWEVHLSLSCGGGCPEIRTAAHVSGTISQQSIY